MWFQLLPQTLPLWWNQLLFPLLQCVQRWRLPLPQLSLSQQLSLCWLVLVLRLSLFRWSLVPQLMFPQQFLVLLQMFCFCFLVWVGLYFMPCFSCFHVSVLLCCTQFWIVWDIWRTSPGALGICTSVPHYLCGIIVLCACFGTMLCVWMAMS